MHWICMQIVHIQCMLRDFLLFWLGVIDLFSNTGRCFYVSCCHYSIILLINANTLQFTFKVLSSCLQYCSIVFKVHKGVLVHVAFNVKHFPEAWYFALWNIVRKCGALRILWNFPEMRRAAFIVKHFPEARWVSVLLLDGLDEATDERSEASSLWVSDLQLTRVQPDQNSTDRTGSNRTGSPQTRNTVSASSSPAEPAGVILIGTKTHARATPFSRDAAVILSKLFLNTAIKKVIKNDVRDLLKTMCMSDRRVIDEGHTDTGQLTAGTGWSLAYDIIMKILDQQSVFVLFVKSRSQTLILYIIEKSSYDHVLIVQWLDNLSVSMSSGNLHPSSLSNFANQ